MIPRTYLPLVLTCLFLSSAAAATSANGTRLPQHARAVCYKVWCYDAGKVSLRGHAGVLDVVKAIRKQPFAEWNTIYYDPSKTDPATMLAVLRAAHCPKATQIDAITRTQGETIARLDNPLAVTGDCLSMALRLPQAAELTWTLPAGWSVALGPTGSSKAGDHAILVQTPTAAAGKHAIELSIAPDDGAAAITCSWSVELVSLVP